MLVHAGNKNCFKRSLKTAEYPSCPCVKFAVPAFDHHRCFTRSRCLALPSKNVIQVTFPPPPTHKKARLQSVSFLYCKNKSSPDIIKKLHFSEAAESMALFSFKSPRQSQGTDSQPYKIRFYPGIWTLFFSTLLD